MNRKVREVINGLLEQFKTGDIPQAIAYIQFPSFDIPCTKWSLLNQLITIISGTNDARGLRQWNKVNRKVKKGAKSIYIIVPYFKKKYCEGEREEYMALSGFMARPVFRIEDTEGEDIDYEKIELPELPLMDRAREWGIKIEALPGNDNFLGYYSPSREIIALASPEEKVFFHELAHASHRRIDNFTYENKETSEIIADFSAMVLCRIVGKSMDRHIGDTYQYIDHYAQELKMSAYNACLKFLSDVEKVLDNILGKENVYVQSEN